MGRYLCDTYDKQHKLLPRIGDVERYKVLYWVHAAEGVWGVHASPIITMRQFQKDGDPKETEAGASVSLIEAMDFFERKLNENDGKFLCGDAVTAADCMMYFMAMAYFVRLSDVTEKKHEAVARYVKDCEATDSFKKLTAKMKNA